MRSIVRIPSILIPFLLLQTSANVYAAPVLYNYEATVSFNLASGLPSAGSSVSGSFWYDTTGAITRNDFDGSQQILAFDHAPPAGQSGITLEFGTSVLASNQSIINTSLTNNPTDSTIAIIDQITIQSGSLLHGLSDIPENVQMQLIFSGGLGVLEDNGVLIPTVLPAPEDLLLDSNWNASIHLRDRDGVLAPNSIFFNAQFTSLSPVPIPAAVWLFGTALIGFIGFSRRRHIT